MVKRRRNQTRLENVFAREIETLWIASIEGTFREFARNLRGLERKYVAAVEHDPIFVLEIKRRVAEYMLEASISRGCAPRLCREKLKENLRLGFTDRWREVYFRLQYAEAFRLRGSSKLAMRMVGEVSNLIGGVERKGPKYDKSQAKIYRAWAARIEAAIVETDRRVHHP
jgi:hypothetical protein